jgi:hypothetical protein
MITCKDPDLCPTVASNNFISAAEAEDAPIHFEVWAVLREQATGNVTGPGRICNISTAKRPPSGWVQPAEGSGPGRQGKIVVLRYPPPKDGRDVIQGRNGNRHVWEDGISKTDALNPG